MHAILLAWKNALDILRPHRLARLVASSFTILSKTFQAFGRSFWWFFAAEAAFFLLFGRYTTQAITQPTQANLVIIVPLVLIQSVLWLLTSSSFFLLMRREEPMPDYPYYLAYLLKYCQLMLSMMVIALVGTSLLLQAGITKLPHISWHAIVAWKVFELMVVFYWLDAPPTLKNLASSFERAVNLCFYNLPLCLILIGIALLINIGGGFLLSLIFKVPVDSLFFSNISAAFTSLAATPKGRLIVLVIKYAVFLLEAAWISLLLGIYRRKRHECYTNSIFS